MAGPDEETEDARVPAPPVASPLPVLYDEAGLLAVSKPAGLATHRTPGVPKEHNCLRLLRDQVGAYLYPVHRLDRPTSGLLLFARDAELAGEVGRAWAAGEVRKLYLGAARGWVESARVDSPVRSGPESKERVDAATAVRALGQIELPRACGRYVTTRWSWFAAEPESGRWHQIRQHLKHLRHPLLGDTRHGDTAHNTVAAEDYGLRRLALHAHRVRLVHPRLGRVVTLVAHLTTDLQAFAGRWGWPAVVDFSASEE